MKTFGQTTKLSRKNLRRGIDLAQFRETRNDARQRQTQLAQSRAFSRAMKTFLGNAL